MCINKREVTVYVFIYSYLIFLYKKTDKNFSVSCKTFFNNSVTNYKVIKFLVTIKTAFA